MASVGRKRAGLTAAAALTLLATGCQYFYELEEFTRPDPVTQAEAGSTHVFGVAYPWRTFVDALQPTFPMTPDLALASAIPTTASFTARTVEAFRGQLGIGLPRSTTTETQTSATDAAGVQSATESRTRSLEPGQAPTPPTALGTVPGASTLPALTAALTEDPFLKYSVANDLYQEIQILNRALREIYIGKDVVPYLVRLKVSPLAYRRKLGYDSYTDVVFFDAAQGEENNPPESVTQASQAAVGVELGPPGCVALLRRSAKVELDRCDSTPFPAAARDRARHGRAPNARLKQLPYVVPLLVTDNLEVASDVVTAQAILELAAAVSGTPGNVGVGGQLQALRDSLNQAQANARNALRTVVRLGDNAIRVRLGAAFGTGAYGTKGYDQTTRTHNVSLLVLVPKAQLDAVKQYDDKDALLQVEARTMLRHAKTGERLPVANHSESGAVFRSIADSFRLPRRVAQVRVCQGKSEATCRVSEADVNTVDRERAVALLSRLREAAFYRDIDEFNNIIDAETDGLSRNQDINGLWTALTSFSGDFDRASFTIRLPKPAARCLPPTGQVVLLSDDAKAKVTTALVSGVAGYEVGDLSARLALGSGAPRDRSEVVAGSVSLTGGLLALTFPSLGTLGLADSPAPAAYRQLPGELRLYGPPVDADCVGKDARERPAAYAGTMPAAYGRLRYTVAEAVKEAAWPKVPPRSVTATRIVAAADGTGQLGVGVAFEPGNPAVPAFVSVIGAEIASASAGQLDPLGRLRLEGPAHVVLTLRNLAVGEKVTVKGEFPPKSATEPRPSLTLGEAVVAAAPKAAGKDGG